MVLPVGGEGDAVDFAVSAPAIQFDFLIDMSQFAAQPANGPLQGNHLAEPVRTDDRCDTFLAFQF